jgi:type IV pilus assembly protein PilM
MIKTLELPIMNSMDLETTVEFQAMEVIPENLDKVLLDYQVTGETREKKQLTVLLTAAKKELVRSYMEVLSEAGLVPRIVDVDYFALQNLCHRLHANTDDQVVCVMHIGASVTTVLVMSKGRLLFSSDLETAGQFFTERLSRGLGISFEEAEVVKLGDRPGSGTNDITGLIRSLCDDYANDLKREMNLFTTMNGTQQIDRLYVCGGGAKLSGLQTTLSEKFNDRVERFDPLFDHGKSSGDSTSGLAPEFAVVGGLAMRQPWQP